ncbi:zinc-binding dehydrogenase [Nonomuraea sp. NPDC055795]
MCPSANASPTSGSGGPTRSSSSTWPPRHCAAAPSPEENRALIRRALDLAADGRWRPVVGQAYPLAEAAAAHAAIESRATLGKTLLKVGA